jgi:hypothetical protein
VRHDEKEREFVKPKENSAIRIQATSDARVEVGDGAELLSVRILCLSVGDADDQVK